MSSLYFENYTDEELTTIFRDLAINEKLDVKLLFEEYKKELKQCQKKHESKADIIIKENKLNKEKKLKERDIERLEYYDELKEIPPKILDDLAVFKTKFGKDKMKMKLLELAYKKDDIPLIIDLYLQVLSKNYDTKHDTRLMEKVTKVMSKMDYKTMQFEKLSNSLSPLDFYNEYKKKLDDWQVKVLNNIDKGVSTLVCAPTSCGKTWLSIYPGISGKKVLFIVPTMALVYQVSSLFIKFGAEVLVISPDFTFGKRDNNVIVGTPKDIEDKLPSLGIKYDIVIYDEIHNLVNKDFCNYYERLIKVLKSNVFLALSATIGNPDKLKSWFDEITNRNTDLVIYTTRFLNLQRHLFTNNKLNKLHPMSCLTKSDINSKFLIKNLPMTPYDCVSLYKTLKEYYGEHVEDLSVPNVFKEDNKRLSLEDARQYETLLKQKLIELKDSENMEEIIKSYKIEDNEGDDDVNLYTLFKEIKNKNLIPCIVFQQNTEYCKEIFSNLVGYLEKLEQLNYPYHYENLEFIEDNYIESEKILAAYKKDIKLPPDFQGNPQFAIEEKVKRKWAQLTLDFEQKYTKHIERQLTLISNSKQPDKVKKIQIKNLKKEYSNFIDNLVLKHTDIFEKHREFCLNITGPMTANKIRDIRRSIKSKLGVKVSYTNVFMQGLKRGIGIYTTDMPPVYNMIVQSLAQNGNLGFVIADVSLALGINMPFRSTCILGYKDSRYFDLYNYLQMIGRSGRRGLDKEGHIIYGNVKWKELMKGELKEVVSFYKNIDNYNVISDLNPEFTDFSNNVYNNILDNKFSGEIKVNDTFYNDSTKNILLWKLREYNECSRFLVDNLFNIEMNYRKNINNDTKVELARYLGLLFISGITDKSLLDSDYKNDFTNYIISVLHKKKIINGQYQNFRKLKEFMIIIKNIYNVIIYDQNKYYQFLAEHLEGLFNTYKSILFNSNGLN
uniref:Helicase ATP-binding domain-containing protein n=1 Tax=viral metagenome TaxID=1070528 RepID=A0A6C0JC75_9ZZZZ